MEIRTIADEIYEEIKRRGKVGAKELVKKFNIDYLLLEELVEEMEKFGLVKIVFPTNPLGDLIIYDREVWENERASRRKGVKS